MATVNLFYLIVIPATLGFMGFFVVIDGGRMLIGRKKKNERANQTDEAALTAEPDNQPEETE